MTITNAMELTTTMTLALVVCSAISVIAMYRVLTNIVEHETELHDLRNRIKEIQYQRELRDAQLRGLVPATTGDVADPVEAIEIAQDAASQVAEALEESAPDQPTKQAA